MRWSYFKYVRNIDEKYFFEKRSLTTKDKIKDYLDKNSFTYTEDELKLIYESVLPKKQDPKPEQTEKPKRKFERKKAVLSQKKKIVRNSSKRKGYVSGSLDK